MKNNDLLIIQRGKAPSLVGDNMKCSTHKWNSSHCCGMFHTSSVWFPQYQAYSIHLAVHSVYCRHILQIGKIKWLQQGKVVFESFTADLYHLQLGLCPALSCGRRMVLFWFHCYPLALATERHGQEDVCLIPIRAHLHQMPAELNPLRRINIYKFWLKLDNLTIVLLTSL